MASGRAPRHDFAPAWLNFPEQRSTGLKISDRDSHRNHHNDYHYMQARHRSMEFYDDRPYSYGGYYGYNNSHYRYQRYPQINGHYYSSPPYRSSSGNGGGGGGRPLRGSKESSSKSTPSSNTTASNTISLEEDFPSLSSESEGKASTTTQSTPGVWDANTRVRILQNSQEHNGKVDSGETKNGHKPGQMYKASLPLKSKKMTPRLNIDNSTASSASPPNSSPNSPQSSEACTDNSLNNEECSSPTHLAEGLEWVGPKELHLLQSLAWDEGAYEWHAAPDELLIRERIKASRDKENQHSNSVHLDSNWKSV